LALLAQASVDPIDAAAARPASLRPFHQ